MSAEFVLSCQVRLTHDWTVPLHVVAIQRSFMVPLVVHLDSANDHTIKGGPQDHGVALLTEL